MLPIGDRRASRTAALEGWHHWLGRVRARTTCSRGSPEQDATPVSSPPTSAPRAAADRGLPRLAARHGRARASAPTPVPPSEGASSRVGVLAAVMEASAQLRGALDRQRRRALGRRARPRARGAARGAFASSSRGPGLQTHLAPRRGPHGRPSRHARGRDRHRPERACGRSTTRTSSTGSPATGPPRRWSTSPSSVASTTSASARPARARQRGMGAGVAVFLTTKMFLEYRGAIFWKMAAGMGDIVFAPLYEALRERGVRLRVLPPRRRPPPVGRSHEDRGGHGRSPGRACVRDAEQLRPAGQIRRASVLPGRAASRASSTRPAEIERAHARVALLRVARRRAPACCATAWTTTTLVFAISLGMVPFTCRRADRRSHASGARWSRTSRPPRRRRCSSGCVEDERALGWPHAGTTVSAYEQPFHTWASMSQLIDVECWPAADRPGAIAYFCGALDASGPAARATGAPTPRSSARGCEQRDRAADRRTSATFCPGPRGGGGFRWELLCGRNGHAASTRSTAQF